MFRPAPQLQQLADALRPALGLGEGARIALPLAIFAAERHRVGPLLHHALTLDGGEADGEAEAYLARSAAANVRRVLMQQAGWTKVSRVLSAEGIDHCEVKGRALGNLLYGSESLRHSKDVDVLVEPARLEAALFAMREAGFSSENGAPLDPQRALAVLRHHHEIALRVPGVAASVELHARLMDHPPPQWDDGDILHGARDLGDARYVYYLLLHGAASRWHRAKWLADLVMIARQTAAEVRGEVFALARRDGALPALAASFHACAALWGRDVVDAWIEATGLEADDAQVAPHLASFERAVHDERDGPQPDPLIRRMELVRSAPLYATQRPSRLRVLRSRIAYWYLRKFRA